MYLQLHGNGRDHEKQPQHHEDDVEQEAWDPLHRKKSAEFPDASKDVKDSEEGDDPRNAQAHPSYDVAVRDLDE